MVYVVERYLPGLSRSDLLPRLSGLEPVTQDLRERGLEVRYLGSTIVLEDEACFCEFESPSETAVAEANRRADLPFDRIVPAVLVQPTQRSAEMSVSTFIPKPAGFRKSPHLAAIAAVISVIALSALAGIVTRAIESGTRPARVGVPTPTSVLRSLTPRERQNVVGILSLTPREKQHVLGILSLTPARAEAALGTSPTSAPRARSATAPASTATASPSVALPILPMCGPGPCWRGATDTGRAASHQR
jgi:hypothetical protein